jgi:hypothetical protein
MTGLRFETPKSFSMDPLAWQTAYLSGIEGLPWFCQRSQVNSLYSIERSIDESSRLSVIWPTKLHGPLLLSTTSLRKSDQPYDLALELARGTIHRMRNQAFEWQRLGLRLSEEFLNRSAIALDRFLDALLTPPGEEHDRAVETAIENALLSNQLLCKGYTEQALLCRHQQEPRLSTLIGVQLPFVPIDKLTQFPILDLSNTVGVALDWTLIRKGSGKADYSIPDSQISWARQRGLRVSGGPLISLQGQPLPEWLMLVDDPFEKLLEAVMEHVRDVVTRYRGKIHLWHVAAGLNTPTELNLTDEQALRLTVHAIQLVRSLDDRAAVIISVDQPWCEYLGAHKEAISPLHFVDALIRADLGLSGIGLEVNHNYWPKGTLPRDLLEFNRLVDQWSLLGLPLMLLMRQPLVSSIDRQANPLLGVVTSWFPFAQQALPQQGQPPIESGRASAKSPLAAEVASPPGAGDILELMLAKQAVQGILWNQLSDAFPHQFPNAGFFSSSGEKREFVERWISLRREHLT